MTNCNDKIGNCDNNDSMLRRQRCMLMVVGLLLSSFCPNKQSAITVVSSFVVVTPTKSRTTTTTKNQFIDPRQCQPHLYSSNNNKDDDDDDQQPPKVHPSGNPYADPNYPDLEFINYDDPEYQIDLGIEDTRTSLSAKSDDELVLIEEMREERRRRNDEYQFQTYYKDVLKNGNEFYGEWTVYKTSTFLQNEKSEQRNVKDSEGIVIPPKFVKARGRGAASNSSGKNQPTFRAISKAFKEIDDTIDSIHSTDLERIRHVETIYSSNDDDASSDGDNDDDWLDTDTGLGKKQQRQNTDIDTTIVGTQETTEEEIMSNIYWPNPLAAIDFRGHQGNMVCGK